MTVVRQASPNPLVGHRAFHIMPVAFDGADMPQNDKERVGDTFVKALANEADEGVEFVPEASADTVVIRSTVTEMDGGMSLGITSTAATIAMRVEILQGGKVVDELIFESEASQAENGSINGVSLGGDSGNARLGSAAEKLADYVADYLEARVNPES